MKRIHLLTIVLVLVTVCAALFFVSRKSIEEVPGTVATSTATTTVSVATSTTQTPATTTAAATSSVVVMSLNKKTTVFGTVFEPTTIVEDSRCPSDVQCIQAGRVRVAVSISSPTGTSSNIFEIDTVVTTENLKITLTKVDPYPVSTHTKENSEYRFTFSIEKRPPGSVVAGKCYVGGCSAEVCSDQPNVASNCIYRPEFACYKTAKCERQTSGACGWTQTGTLKACLSSNSSL